MQSSFLPAIIKRFEFYKDLGDKTFLQLDDPGFLFQPSGESNSIAVIIQHLHGNAMSRWSNILTEDGEKDWRKRDEEFESANSTKTSLLFLWNSSWELIIKTLSELQADDLLKTIYIRKEPLPVFDAVLRHLAHFAYHIGQVVYIAKLLKDKEWNSLSIPKGQSILYNQKSS